jgi:hypothetical protein
MSGVEDPSLPLKDDKTIGEYVVKNLLKAKSKRRIGQA